MIPESWIRVSRRRSMNEPPSQIERHKTAIRRKDFSLAVKCLLRDGLLGPGRTFFDYGCGRGEDIDLLAAQGVTASGWDPAFRRDARRTPAEIVNLGYVLNVIEDPQERAEVLASAWGLATRLLAVAARVNVEGRGYSPVEFGDGIVTGLGTFQKISKNSSAHIRGRANGPTRFSSAPATRRQSMRLAADPRSANCSPTRCTSIAARATGLSPSCGCTRDAPGRTWGKWRERTSSSCTGFPEKSRISSTRSSILSRTPSFCVV